MMRRSGGQQHDAPAAIRQPDEQCEAKQDAVQSNCLTRSSAARRDRRRSVGPNPRRAPRGTIVISARELFRLLGSCREGPKLRSLPSVSPVPPRDRPDYHVEGTETRRQRAGVTPAAWRPNLSSALSENALDRADGNPIDLGDLGNRHPVFHPGPDAGKFRPRNLACYGWFGANRRSDLLATHWRRLQNPQDARFAHRVVDRRERFRNRWLAQWPFRCE